LAEEVKVVVLFDERGDELLFLNDSLVEVVVLLPLLLQFAGEQVEFICDFDVVRQGFFVVGFQGEVGGFESGEIGLEGVVYFFEFGVLVVYLLIVDVEFARFVFEFLALSDLENGLYATAFLLFEGLVQSC
jgi:hypothetical protein